MLIDNKNIIKTQYKLTLWIILMKISSKYKLIFAWIRIKFIIFHLSTIFYSYYGINIIGINGNY